MTKAVTNTEVAQQPQVKGWEGFHPMGEQTKVCQSCGLELPLSQFPKHRLSADGHMAECRDCRRRKRNAPGVESNPLEKFTARELMHELSVRGYRGSLTYTETKVQKMDLKDF